MNEAIDRRQGLALIGQLYDAALKPESWREAAACAAAFVSGAKRRGHVALVAPHVARALEVIDRLHDAETAGIATRVSLDRIACGVLLLDTRAEVIFANRAARRILAERDGIALAPLRGLACRRLVIQDPRSRAHLDATLANSCGEDVADRHYGDAAIPRPSGRLAYILQCLLLPSPDAAEEGVAHAIVFLIDPTDDVTVDRAVLQKLYRLTETEILVAERVCRGDRVSEAASRLGIAVNTARAHLKSVFLKTGVTRQSGLVKRFLSLSASR